MATLPIASSHSRLRPVVGSSKDQRNDSASPAGKAQRKNVGPCASTAARQGISSRSLPIGDISSGQCADTWASWVEQSIAVEVAADGSYMYPADNLPDRSAWSILLRITKLNGREIIDTGDLRNATKDIEPGDLLHGSAHCLRPQGGLRLLPNFVVIEKTQNHLRMIRGRESEHLRFVLGRYNLWRVMTFLRAETSEGVDKAPPHLSFNPQVVPANLFGHRLLRWADQPVFLDSSDRSRAAALPLRVNGPEHQVLLEWLSRSWPPAHFKTMVETILADAIGLPANQQRQITRWVRNLTRAFCRLRLVQSGRANTYKRSSL